MARRRGRRTIFKKSRSLVSIHKEIFKEKKKERDNINKVLEARHKKLEEEKLNEKPKAKAKRGRPRKSVSSSSKTTKGNAKKTKPVKSNG